jgi:hypothetical protein
MLVMANLDSKLIKISRVHLLYVSGIVDEIMAGSFTVRQSKAFWVDPVKRAGAVAESSNKVVTAKRTRGKA